MFCETLAIKILFFNFNFYLFIFIYFCTTFALRLIKILIYMYMEIPVAQGKKLPLVRPSETSTLVSQTSGFPKTLVLRDE